MKVGGQILWNVTPICETSQIYYLMGRRPMKDVLGNHLKDRLFPFGSLVEYHPITAKDQSRIHQFGKKVLPGLFLGYALFVGEIWKGDVLIADLEELETMDASEIYSKRLNAKEVISPEQGEFIFPIADGRIKLPGGDQELRTSTLVRHRPIQGESNIDSLFHSNTLTYPELLIRVKLWMSSRTTHTRSASMTIGISMGLETCLILGQVSHNLLYWKKKLPTDICGPGRD